MTNEENKTNPESPEGEELNPEQIEAVSGGTTVNVGQIGVVNVGPGGRPGGGDSGFPPPPKPPLHVL